MKRILNLALISLLAIALFGCSGVEKGQSSTDSTVTSETPKSEAEIAAQQALLAPMDQTAKKHLSANTAWGSLTSEEKQPFLDFHSGNEEKAEKHYAGMLDSHRDMQSQN